MEFKNLNNKKKEIAKALFNIWQKSYIIEKEIIGASIFPPLDRSENDFLKSKNNFYGIYESKELGSVPVNFLSDLDITNGNSGSATINNNFELVGLAFDGMLETIISDYSFVPEARTISVDSRYLLWTLDKVENAENILEEITIVN